MREPLSTQEWAARLSSTMAFNPRQARGRDGRWIRMGLPYALSPKPYEPPAFVDTELADPAMRERVEATMTQFVNDVYAAPAEIAIGEEALLAFLNDGQFKTAWDEGHITDRQEVTDTGGLGGFVGDPDEEKPPYMELRGDYERVHIGVPDDVPSNQRPISGWLRQPRDPSAPEWESGLDAMTVSDLYGETSIVLKESVKGRSSVTIGDSADNLSHPVAIGALNDMTPTDFAGMGFEQAWEQRHMVTKANEAAKLQRQRLIDMGKSVGPERTPDDPDKYLDKARWGNYWEMQVYGGLTLDDVEKVTFGYMPPGPVQDALEAKGIPWEVREV